MEIEKMPITPNELRKMIHRIVIPMVSTETFAIVDTICEELNLPEWQKVKIHGRLAYHRGKRLEPHFQHCEKALCRLARLKARALYRDDQSS